MDTFKQVISVIGAIVGLVSSLIPLFARFLDKKRQAGERDNLERVRKRAPRKKPAPAHAVAVVAEDAPREVGRNPQWEPAVVEAVSELSHHEDAPHDAARLVAARRLVKGPAIALLVTGLLGLAGNVLFAAFGVVDGFVMPLTTQSEAEWAAAARVPENQAEYEKMRADRQRNQAQSVMAIVMLLSFTMASAMAAWAGFNMMKLKSYWLSMAGSIAAMPAGCLCCFAGVPVGIWSIVTLLRPEVSSSFYQIDTSVASLNGAL
jgi:hypothetical protein